MRTHWEDAAGVGDSEYTSACDEPSNFTTVTMEFVPEEVRSQSYCDWCFSEMNQTARAGSLAIGLPMHLSWACDSCLSDGAYRSPPDGWEGDPADWPPSSALLLTADELGVVINALNEVLHRPDAIEDWEFQTRMGQDKSLVQALLRRLVH